MSQQRQQRQQRQPGESALEADGEEIQSIGYESAAELGAQTEAKAVSSGGKVAEEPARSSSSSGGSSQNDICRICHMGSGGSGASARALDLGPLVSACRCRGTVGLVHAKCLERWLTESGHTRCELCGYRYATIRVPRHGLPRALLVWLRSFVATRQMLLDWLYLLLTTPLAVFSAYVCALGLKLALDNRLAQMPWSLLAMLPTCSLTLVAYWGWLLTLQRLHGRRWRQYWQSNFVIRLLPDRPLLDRDEPYDQLPQWFDLV